MAQFELGTDGPKVILVGIDGSETSLRAAAYAAGLARRQGSRFVVVHVATTPSMAGLAPSAAGLYLETAESRVQELRAIMEDGARTIGMQVEFITTAGDPFSEISRIATDVRADAVVVGASSQAGHRLVGSLGVRLVRAGRWPLTVVP